MKVLLVHPPVDYRVPQMYRTESLGLGYIGAVLRDEGHEVEIFDPHIQCLGVDDAIRSILSREFDMLGITAAGEHWKVVKRIVQKVRRKRKDAIICVGGYLPTLNAEQLLTAVPEIDFLVRGEGEQVICDVVRRLEKGQEWREAPGVAFLNDGVPVLNPLPPLIQDLDSLPFPARDALDQAKGPVSAGVASSRGCFRRCSFCCVQSFYGLSGGHGMRFRSPEKVVDEIQEIVETRGIHDFRFVDDDFLGPSTKTRERVVRIAEEIIKRKLKIRFTMECRADEVDEDVLKLLKEAGLTWVFLGIESGVQRQLDTYNKRTTVEQNRRAIEIVRRSGIKLRSGFIMFDPYTTLSEIEQNLRFIRETGIGAEARGEPVPFITKLAVYRGVPLVEQLQKDGLLREKGIEIDYVFKDPLVGLIWKAVLALGTCSAYLAGILGRIGRKEIDRRFDDLEEVREQ